MKTLDAGHEYECDSYDGAQSNRLVFMKRKGEGYPFNAGHHAGTNCQEVIRVLIDRVEYLQRQIRCDENVRILANLRDTLLCFERRAAYRHDRTLELTSEPIETWPTCLICGHVQCVAHFSVRVPDDRHEFKGVAMIAQERERQVSVEGWTLEHDASYRFGQMSVAAACYAVEGTDASVSYPDDDPEGSGWPWGKDWWKPKDRIRNLTRAGALIAAEIDRQLALEPAAAAVHAAEPPKCDGNHAGPRCGDPECWNDEDATTDSLVQLDASKDSANSNDEPCPRERNVMSNIAAEAPSPERITGAQHRLDNTGVSIREAAELIANCYCPEEDDYVAEVERLTEEITRIVITNQAEIFKTTLKLAIEVAKTSRMSGNWSACDDEIADEQRARIISDLTWILEGKPDKGLTEPVRQAVRKWRDKEKS